MNNQNKIKEKKSKVMSEWLKFLYWLIDFNVMWTCLELFYAIG